MTDQTPEPPRQRKWVMPLLVASLAVNLLVAGLVVGAMLKGPPEGRAMRGGEGGPRSGPQAMSMLTSGLDRMDRRALFQALRQSPDLQSARAALRQAQRDVIAALAAEPFDPAAFQTALVAHREVQGTLARTGSDVFAQFIEGMSAEDRAALAARARDRMSRRR